MGAIPSRIVSRETPAPRRHLFDLGPPVVLAHPVYEAPPMVAPGALVRHRVLSADQPWRFDDRLPGRGRGAAKHYQTLSVEELLRFPLPLMERDSVLFLWRVSAMQQEALDVIRAWGFTLKSELVWCKTTRRGKRHMGMGRIVRGEHETCLIATRGRPVCLVKNMRSTFDAPVRRHSEKPAEFFAIVERLYRGPYVELFARRNRPGWTTLGNQVGLLDGVAA